MTPVANSVASVLSFQFIWSPSCNQPSSSAPIDPAEGRGVRGGGGSLPSKPKAATQTPKHKAAETDVPDVIPCHFINLSRCCDAASQVHCWLSERRGGGDSEGGRPIYHFLICFSCSLALSALHPPHGIMRSSAVCSPSPGELATERLQPASQSVCHSVSQLVSQPVS